MKRGAAFVFPYCIAAAIAIVTWSRAAAVDFTFGFDGLTDRIGGSPGEVVEVGGYITLTTENDESPDGAQGWQAIAVVEGGTAKSATLNGVVVSTIYDEDPDRNPETPPIHHDPYLQDLGGKDIFARTAVAEDACMAVAAVLRAEEKMVLQPSGTQRIARFSIRAKVPEDGSPATISLKFIDDPTQCDICIGGNAVFNAVTFDSRAIHIGKGLSVRDATISIGPTAFRRADVNSDEREDVSDVISTICYLFLGGEEPTCLKTADVNDDGRIDITDALVTLTDLFDPSAGDVLAPPGFRCGTDPTADGVRCDGYEPCR